ncbi:hypothetical protein ACQ859_25845 [Roseateles chitinivorans]|uniref:hypothetical protein n=1 Tax=Roseateles chitinivorans TaxID=2917965 RepID=UPI003D669BA5
MDGEITRLTGTSPLDTGTFGGDNEYGQALEINKWLAGGAGISTTHYNPGQNQYYSPVGFVVDVPDGQVLGHFEGDGSTSLLHEGRQQYWRAFEAIRAAMLDGGVIQGAIDGQGYGGDFAAPVTDLMTAKTLKGRIEAFLGDGAVSADAKAAARTVVKRCATAALQDHYQNNGFNHPLGPGSPNVLSALEANLVGLAPGQGYQNLAQGRENKYTESQVHAELPQVVGAFYAAEPGQYPADLINARWLIANADWQANRLADARNFNQKFTAAGNNQVELMHLAGGRLANGPAPGASIFPPSFYVWALAIVGIALLYKNSGELMALYRRYMAGR